MSKIASYTKEHQGIGLNRTVIFGYSFILSLLVPSTDRSQMDKVRPNPSSDFRGAP